MRPVLESFGVNRHHEETLVNPDDALDASLTNSKDGQSPPAAKAEFSDEALMAAYASGNLQAFEALYLRHKDPLLRYFIRQVSPRETAEELFQETWQSLIKNAKSYKSSAKFTTYLYTIAHSRLVDFYRKNGRLGEFAMDDQYAELEATKDSQPERLLDLSQLGEQLLAALDQLAAAQKEVFILKFEAGMTVPEIAESLGDNAEAVKSRLRYAIANLKGFFKAEELKVESN
ncbi:sigma-70 family RNA polymerase sigma factor [Kangiella sp. TOML190]|uniref:sigma-70 family RNA polymerase sigma factor n=1 Tax=Kangiella sp. TOML190 TaxID=2931351 RepID=UPI00203B1959|nr:sigma-70 family RNA polymerase sigma factor [Kangiella sp. TOML190]